MNTIIKMNDDLVAKILNYAKTFNMDFDAAINDLCLKSLAIDSAEFEELNETETEELINRLLQFAVEEFDETNPGFKLSELYINCTEDKWMALSPSYRKKLGREFIKAVSLMEQNHKNHKSVYLFGKNINNSAVYRIRVGAR